MGGTSLGRYMRWLTDQGGRCSTGIGLDPDIGMVPVTRLEAANGRSVIHYGTDESEVLAPAMIAYFDRRLGGVSPFRSGTAH